jgi:hypothetical protein
MKDIVLQRAATEGTGVMNAFMMLLPCAIELAVGDEDQIFCYLIFADIMPR